MFVDFFLKKNIFWTFSMALLLHRNLTGLVQSPVHQPLSMASSLGLRALQNRAMLSVRSDRKYCKVSFTFQSPHWAIVPPLKLATREICYFALSPRLGI